MPALGSIFASKAGDKAGTGDRPGHMTSPAAQANVLRAASRHKLRYDVVDDTCQHVSITLYIPHS